MKETVLVTGASGYVGTRLVNSLLIKNKYKIINYDISLYGDEHLPIKNPDYLYVNGDLRDVDLFSKTIKKNNVESIIHLACISNDPTFELKSDLSKIINFKCFEPLVKISKINGVKKFIYASTCSVYGVSDKANITEDHPLLPITDYNKYKAKCEPVLQKYLDRNFTGIIIRPATVCGYSEKMRFDLSVNILTNFAFNKGFIKVFGGEQKRPNIHIDDMCRLYENLLEINFNPLNGEIFNAGCENLKIIDIAKKVKKIVEEKNGSAVEIITEPSDDIRSYHINAEKIKKKLNFNFEKNVDDAINDLCNAFFDKKIKNSFDEKWKNINILKKKIESL